MSMRGRECHSGFASRLRSAVTRESHPSKMFASTLICSITPSRLLRMGLTIERLYAFSQVFLVEGKDQLPETEPGSCDLRALGTGSQASPACLPLAMTRAPVRGTEPPASSRRSRRRPLAATRAPLPSLLQQHSQSSSAQQPLAVGMA
eukprot:97379-Rhodomonas_salina.4